MAEQCASSLVSFNRLLGCTHVSVGSPSCGSVRTRKGWPVLCQRKKRRQETEITQSPSFGTCLRRNSWSSSMTRRRKEASVTFLSIKIILSSRIQSPLMGRPGKQTTWPCPRRELTGALTPRSARAGSAESVRQEFEVGPRVPYARSVARLSIAPKSLIGPVGKQCFACLCRLKSNENGFRMCSSEYHGLAEGRPRRSTSLYEMFHPSKTRRGARSPNRFNRGDRVVRFG